MSFLIPAVCLSQSPSEGTTPPKGYKMLKRTGGKIARPNTQKGKIVFFNAQKQLPLETLRSGIDDFVNSYKFKIEFVEISTFTLDSASDEMKKAGAQIAVFLSDSCNVPVTFLTAPEQHWAVINVKNVTSGAKNQTFAAARIRKEMMRAFLCAAGAMDSQYDGSMMSPISSANDLDKVIEDPPVDALMRAMKTMKFVGVTPLELTTYKQACQEGWAPAPTNEIQKAVWDKVNAAPKNPMKIEFDPKKGR